MRIAFVYTNSYTIPMKVSGFEWDDGNWPKCGKHGVSQDEIEEMFLGAPAVMADPNPKELRQRAIGKTANGRYVFVVFVYRLVGGNVKIRPISARFMHQREIDRYEG